MPRYECQDELGRSFEDRVESLEIELAACQSDRDAYRRTLSEIRELIASMPESPADAGRDGDYAFLAGFCQGMLRHLDSKARITLEVWTGFETEAARVDDMSQCCGAELSDTFHPYCMECGSDIGLLTN